MRSQTLRTADLLLAAAFVWIIASPLTGMVDPTKAFAAKPKAKEPKWPTTKSPPPIPAFQPKHSADPGGTSTPLAQLHNKPPQVERPKTVLEHAKAKAMQAAKSNAKKGFMAAIKPPNYFPFGKRPDPTSTALVSDLQKIINSHGGKLTPDGLYGPKTAAAWSALAKRNGLAPAITRQGPKIAKVFTATFERLRVAPIP